jgi:hypothetical protein
MQSPAHTSSENSPRSLKFSQALQKKSFSIELTHFSQLCFAIIAAQLPTPLARTQRAEAPQLTIRVQSEVNRRFWLLVLISHRLTYVLLVGGQIMGVLTSGATYGEPQEMNTKRKFAKEAYLKPRMRGVSLKDDAVKRA